MTEFEQVVEECLLELEHGTSSVDQCLARHPQYAAQLKPILLAVVRLERGREIKPSPALKARTRAKLIQYMQAHPRQHVRWGFTFMRLATNLAVILLTMLLAGTAYAQSALPGDLFYEWKLTSELVWRAVSPNPVATDIAIANRRIKEMNAVADDPIRRARALEGYLAAVERLKSELDTETLEDILPVIDASHPTEEVPPAPSPKATETPSIIPTELPQVIPTLVVPPSLP